MACKAGGLDKVCLRLIADFSGRYSLDFMVTVAWTPLKSQTDIDQLLNAFGGFHDGCIREAHIWTEHYVLPDLRMSCTGDLDTRVRLLVQRQFKAPSAIELLFEQVITLHLHPSPENYDSIILSAAMLHEDNTFYWADSVDWSPASSRRDEFTWIAAKKVSWRDASDWMGPDLHYGARDSTYEV